MTDLPARLVRLAQQLEDQHAPQHMTVLMREAAKEMDSTRAGPMRKVIDDQRMKIAEQAARIEQLEAALREMAQEDGTNARRMRTAIVMARKKLDISRPMWTGPILQADGILAQALTVDNDRAALGEKA